MQEFALSRRLAAEAVGSALLVATVVGSGIMADTLTKDMAGAASASNTAVPWLVGLYITAAYWFTASTSFANPAVAVARSLTNTFSGIRPEDLPGFIVAELCGAVARLLLMGWLLSPARTKDPLPQEAKL